MYQQNRQLREKLEYKRKRLSESLVRPLEDNRRSHTLAVSMESNKQDFKEKTIPIKKLNKLPSITPYRRMKTSLQSIPDAPTPSPLPTLLTSFLSNPNLTQLPTLASTLHTCFPPFLKLSQPAIYTILLHSSINSLKPGTILYRRDQPSSSLFIILYGCVVLSNRQEGFRRKCRAGETLGEEIVFTENRFVKTVVRREKGVMPRLETAKALAESCVMELEGNMLKVLNQSLIKQERKIDMILLEKFLWRNFRKKTDQRLESLT